MSPTNWSKHRSFGLAAALRISNIHNAVFVWDSEDVPPPVYSVKVLWRNYGVGEHDDAVSVPQLVENNAGRLRARYLAWIHEIGEARIGDKRLVEHLELRPGFSYWWMSLFAEKCNYSKSTQIDDAIRLMAFEEWAANRSIGRIVLATANQPLAECLRAWCANQDVAFEWQRTTELSARLSWLKRAFRAAPHALRALVWLMRYLIDRWPLRGAGLMEFCRSDGSITFFSYSDNLIPGAVEQGRYESRYWAHLPEALRLDACNTTWIHLYVKDALLPTSKQAADVIRALNEAGQGKQRHAMLDTFLSMGVVLRTLGDWLKLQWASLGMKKKMRAAQRTALDLWPLFEDDWRQSVSGTVAMGNLLNLNLFESALGCLPRQRCGVYLQENQGWEFSLIQAWRAAGHGRLTGVPHSTIRYWDLRYFFDPRSYRRTGRNDLPMPDQVALNGAPALDAYKNAGYPVDELVEVEALRYLDICKFKVQASDVPVSTEGALRVLVLGDYLVGNTRRQMNLLAEALQALPMAAVFIVKPHPNCPIRPADYPGISMEVKTESVAKLLAECDVAYASAVTSAAVDAYCAGVPTVSVRDPNTLNLSPLRGCAGALFVSTPKELANALASVATTPCALGHERGFFTLDTRLPRWRRLLAEASKK